MANPLQQIVTLWTTSEEAFKLSDVRLIWPELADALDGLVSTNSHIITADSPGAVPTVAPPVPRSAPRSHSAARWDTHGTYPTSGHIHPVQIPLPLDLGEEE